MEEELKKICKEVAKDHHKHRDGIVTFDYDAWNDEWSYSYYGYIYDSFSGTAKTFEKAKEKVRKNLVAFNGK